MARSEKASRLEMRRALELYALLRVESLRINIRTKMRAVQKRIVEFEEELQQANRRLNLNRPPLKRDLR